MKHRLTWYNITGEHQQEGTLEELKPTMDRLNDCDILYSIEPIEGGTK